MRLAFAAALRLGPATGTVRDAFQYKGRERVRIADAPDVFLDAKHGSGGTVCPRERFVRRRRPLQRFLKILKTHRGADGYHPAGLDPLPQSTG